MFQSMSKSYRRLLIIGVALLVFIVLLFTVLSGDDADDTRYSFATGNTTGLYYPIGGGISVLWSREMDDFNMRSEVTSGSLANVIQVIEKESDVGIGQGNVVADAVFGEGQFSEEMPVSLLFTAYPNAVQVITLENSGIETMGDLRGKTVSLGEPGSGTLISAIEMLDALGISEDDMNAQYLSYSETTNAIRDGQIQAGVIVGGIGVSAIRELAASSRSQSLRLINFTHPDFSPRYKDGRMVACPFL